MVKKSLLMILALALGAALLAGPSWAVGRQFVEVGLGDRWFDYKEDLTPPLKSNESGWVPSARFAYNYQGVDNPIYAEVSFRYSSATTDYDGSLQDGTPAEGHSDCTWWNFEFLAGYIVRNFISTPIRLIPYAGLGYRMWERNLGGTDPYKEEYTWWYLPVGVRLDVPLTTEFTIGVDASIRVMFGGQLLIDFDEPGWTEPDLSLGNRIGYKLQIPMNYQFNPAFSIGINPWYEYIRIGASDTQSVTGLSDPSESLINIMSVKEPASDTHEYGVDVGIRFWF